MINPDMIRGAIDALGGCEAAGALMGTNSRTVRRWYAGKKEPGLVSLNRMRTLLAARAQEIANLAEDFT